MPEWGHATNAFVVVGRRERSRGLFLDRRAFLASYDPTQDDATTWPITDITVNSVIATPLHGETVERSGFTVRGVAWDRGSGIRNVEISLDGGNTWQNAYLDRELSRYAFRSFRLESGPLPRGTAEIRVRAISNSRETQPDVWRPNPSGYHFNVPQRLTVTVA